MGLELESPLLLSKLLAIEVIIKLLEIRYVEKSWAQAFVMN